MEEQNPFVFIFKGSHRYTFLKPLGRGAYGYVCSAKDNITQQEVAIKRIPNLDNNIVLLRTLRELKLLKHFRNQQNIINIITTIIPETKNFSEIFVIQECMEADLHYIIHGGNKFTIEHIRYLLYQLVNGIRVIHKAGVIHRDLKPSNCLINSKCVLKICDFGLAREECNEYSEMSNYVQTRWYRAPELLFRERSYGYKVDMWSIGCIFAEMLERKPFLPGKSTENQIQLIFEVLGTPKDYILYRINNDKMMDAIKKIPLYDALPFDKLFPEYNDEIWSILDLLLVYDQDLRADADKILKHKWFEQYGPIKELDICSFEGYVPDGLSPVEMKREMYSEILDFYKEDMIEKTIELEEDMT